ncbi:MAG TPA: MarR family transcriptional regulator [Coriobacteriia bacterium]
MTGLDALSAEVFSALRRATHLNRQLLGRMMAEHGDHPGAAGVLRALAERDGITQRDLAEVLHLSRPTVTTMLQRLEQNGLIERWDDEADQRLTRIRLTERGRSQSEMVKGSFVAYIDDTIGSMAEPDRRELARLLNILADNTAAALARPEAPAPSGDND